MRGLVGLVAVQLAARPDVAVVDAAVLLVPPAHGRNVVGPRRVHGPRVEAHVLRVPAGVPVGTLAIGRSGAVNAGILAGSIVALQDNLVATALAAWRKRQTDAVPNLPKVT